MTKKQLVNQLDDVKDNEQLIVAYWTKDNLEWALEEKISNAKWNEIVDRSDHMDWSWANDDIHAIAHEVLNNSGIRVYDLANQYNLTSKYFIQLLKDECGIYPHHLSTLDSDTVKYIRQSVAGQDCLIQYQQKQHDLMVTDLQVSEADGEQLSLEVSAE